MSAWGREDYRQLTIGIRNRGLRCRTPVEITFLIPAYNEARTIAEVLDRIAALGLDYEAIVVDDGSTDATA